MSAAKRCALYLRVSKSTGEQTVDNQVPEVEALAAARGFEVVERYVDEQSAVKRRPSFDRMMLDARRGRFNVVLVWSLDRLGRGFSCFDTYRDLARLGVSVASVREPWTETEGPARDLLVSVMSWVSGFERERLIERTKAGLQRARRQGKVLGRPRTSIVLLMAAREVVGRGGTITEAALKVHVSRRALQRYLRENPLSAAGGNGPVLAVAG